MTEKRFYVDKSGDFRDTKTGSIIVDFGYSFNGMECKMILDLLNSLNDENEQLKKDNAEYIHGLNLLKLESQSWKSDVRELREQNCQLEKENEQLKGIIKQSKQDVRRLHSELMMRRGY